MRLLVESELRPAGGGVGAGFDELRRPLPVRPGDELRIESAVIEVRPSKSRPELALLKVRTTTLNQNGETVQVAVTPARLEYLVGSGRPPGPQQSSQACLASSHILVALPS
jgi:acyl dehydratase